MSKLKLLDICNISTGKLDSNQFVEGGQYPFFTCAKDPVAIDSYAFDDDVILIAGNNASGNFHLNRFKGKFNAYQRTYVLTAKNGNNLDYVFYSLKLELQRLKERAQGSQTKFLTMPILNDIHIAKLNSKSQQNIAAVLSALDAKIDLNNRINAELEAMAKTLYDYWFVQFDFPFDFAQDKPDKNGRPYKSSGGKMVWNKELKREIPDGWTAGSLVDLGDIVGGSTPTTTDQNNFSESGTPWITPKDLANCNGNKFISKGELGVTAQGMKSASLKLYPKETVLLSSRAPIGYMTIARNPLTTNQGFKSIIPSKGYSSYFVYYTLKNSMATIVQYASGSTFKEVSGSVLKTVKLCLPKGSIVDTYTKTVASIFDRQDILERENQHLSSLRDWLLPMLMNGQVKVN